MVVLWAAQACAFGQSDNAVVPGRCVGRVCLGDTRSNVGRVLAGTKTTLRKKEMVVDVWSSGDCEKFLFVSYLSNRVAEIHWNSSAYKTSSGISSASTFQEVRAAFPEGKESEYAIFESGKNRVDWDVPERGIVFSIAGDEEGPIVRIAIYRPNSSKLIGYSDGDSWYWSPSCVPKHGS